MRLRKAWILFVGGLLLLYMMLAKGVIYYRHVSSELTLRKENGHQISDQVLSEVDKQKQDATLWQNTRQELTKTSNITKVILLSYIRAGSSIAGEMFNTDPRSTLWYEPLDAFYNSFFGFGKHTLPQNIVLHRNGSLRSLPDRERSRITEYVQNLLDCDLQRLPPEALSHYFLTESSAMNNYWACFSHMSKKNAMRKEYDRCKEPLANTKICGKHVDQAMASRCDLYMDLARKFVFQDKTGHARVSDSFVHAQSDLRNTTLLKRTLQIFVNQVVCMQKIKLKLVRPCLQRAVTKCKESSIRVAEITRLRISDVQNLVRDIPNLNVVYFVRDPRAIVNSRLHTKGLMWDLEDRRHIREAGVFCPRMFDDFKNFMRLNETFPGVFQTVRYEDLVFDPTGVAEKVFSKLNLQVSLHWELFANRTMHARKASNKSSFGIRVANATRVAEKWRDETPPDELERISLLCAEITKVFGFTE